MNPKLLKVPIKRLESFSVRHDAVPYFYKELHFHPEIELVHIHKGNGTQIIGPHIQNFKAGDLIMVGPHLAHLWRCNKQYFNKHSKLKAEATVVHFLPEALGVDFFLIPENIKIQKLLTRSKLGLSIQNKTKEKVASLMEALLIAKVTNKIILLLEILITIANSKEVEALNKKDILQLHANKETDRLNDVFQFLLNHFQEEVTLKEIANVANLSPNAFCRYFKLRTNKTYSSFLLELRINHACKLLTETNCSIHNICYESGFNNTSNFNRYFKQLTNFSPLQYRNKFNEMETELTNL